VAAAAAAARGGECGGSGAGAAVRGGHGRAPDSGALHQPPGCLRRPPGESSTRTPPRDHRAASPPSPCGALCVSWAGQFVSWAGQFVSWAGQFVSWRAPSLSLAPRLGAAENFVGWPPGAERAHPFGARGRRSGALRHEGDAGRDQAGPRAHRRLGVRCRAPVVRPLRHAGRRLTPARPTVDAAGARAALRRWPNFSVGGSQASAKRRWSSSDGQRQSGVRPSWVCPSAGGLGRHGSVRHVIGWPWAVVICTAIHSPAVAMAGADARGATTTGRGASSTAGGGAPPGPTARLQLCALTHRRMTVVVRQKRPRLTDQHAVTLD
jgi:hypothetical protein